MKIETVHNALGAMMSLHTEVVTDLLREQAELQRTTGGLGVQLKEAAAVKKRYDDLCSAVEAHLRNVEARGLIATEDALVALVRS